MLRRFFAWVVVVVSLRFSYVVFSFGLECKGVE